MKIRLTIIAVADRVPSCNLFTMTHTKDYTLADRPTPATVRSECLALKQAFREAWPHNQSCAVLIPLDVDIKEVDS